MIYKLEKGRIIPWNKFLRWSVQKRERDGKFTVCLILDKYPPQVLGAWADRCDAASALGKARTRYARDYASVDYCRVIVREG